MRAAPASREAHRRTCSICVLMESRGSFSSPVQCQSSAAVIPAPARYSATAVAPTGCAGAGAGGAVGS
eukprot:CAMPEP_0203861840 /NCGR_PEP_ID=MMETSP0359-20131031/13249_1 /ASSEMBLY_ACC=CAM_ASM_000338 /TAXON_ID=268821 /ORGANISM="Scrippsiella Hangoei, Strain SHTV-5" /LENGTH=67 /DNA_ID=CAMNT_0050779145 /DNA_START=81 /DNA_END=281 /DNA_ORIENTATION=+